VNFGVQRLDSPVQTFGAAGVITDVLNGDAGVANGLGGAAGGEEVDVFGMEEGCEGEEGGFVRDGEEGSGYGDYVGLGAFVIVVFEMGLVSKNERG
jgi:hypothetical protein